MDGPDGPRHERGQVLVLATCSVGELVYIAVDDIEAVLGKLEETGGKIHVPPVTVPPGTFSVVQDPQGATVTVIELSHPDA